MKKKWLMFFVILIMLVSSVGYGVFHFVKANKYDSVTNAERL